MNLVYLGPSMDLEFGPTLPETYLLAIGEGMPIGSMGSSLLYAAGRAHSMVKRATASWSLTKIRLPAITGCA